MPRLPTVIARWLLFAMAPAFFSSCTAKNTPPSEAVQGYWILSERFTDHFLRLELYPNRVEGLPSLTMEFGIRAESQGATWNKNRDAIEIHYPKPTPKTVRLTPVHSTALYRGKYAQQKPELPLMEVQLGSERKLMFYTESDAAMDRYLRLKNKLRLDVVWGPSSDEVIEAMFRLAKPTRADVVFDLGCGDARILIAAAKKFGARGVGYDLDRELLAKGMANAKKQKVGELITLKSDDLFSADLSQASIVALFLNDRINSKLKPKLFRELKPGTRVVSNTWHMGDWRADARVRISDSSRFVYFWLMPANFSGVWRDPAGAVLTVRQHYQMVELEAQGDGVSKSSGEAQAKGTMLEYQPIGVMEIQGETLVVRSGALAGRVFRRKPGTAQESLL